MPHKRILLKLWTYGYVVYLIRACFLFRTEIANAGFSDHYQRELYEQKGITELRAFVAASLQAKPQVLHTEERFSVKIGPTTLVGRIDRIDRAAMALLSSPTTKPEGPDRRKTPMTACNFLYMR